MGDPAKRRATYEDLLAVPENLVAEIINGTLVTLPRRASLQARASSRLGAELDGPFDRGKGGPGGWILLFEPELHLHGDIVVPDIAGWRRECRSFRTRPPSSSRPTGYARRCRKAQPTTA